MQITLGFAIRLVIIAASLTLLANGLYGLVAFPDFWLNVPAIFVGAAVGAASVPRAHWVRAGVGATAFAAILVLVAILKKTIGPWVTHGALPEDWRHYASLLLIAFLYFVPFFGWLAYGKYATNGREDS